jgi:hypothetical protein
MRGKCPACRTVIDLEDALLDQDLIAIGKLRTAFGANDYLVWAYIELFGVLPLVKRRKKTLKLLTDMKRLFDSGGFEYDRRRYEISAKGIAEGLNTVVTHYFTEHIENHNYLKKVLIGIAGRETQGASRQAERDLRGREDALCAGDGRAADPIPEGGIAPPVMKTIPPAHLTEEEIAANRRRLKEMIGKLDGGSDGHT